MNNIFGEFDLRRAAVEGIEEEPCALKSFTGS